MNASQAKDTHRALNALQGAREATNKIQAARSSAERVGHFWDAGDLARSAAGFMARVEDKHVGMEPVRVAATDWRIVATLAEFVAEHFPWGMETNEEGDLIDRKTETVFERGLDPAQARALAAAVNLFV